jgi:hypothetical protein
MGSVCEEEAPFTVVVNGAPAMTIPPKTHAASPGHPQNNTDATVRMIAVVLFCIFCSSREMLLPVYRVYLV